MENNLENKILNLENNVIMDKEMENNLENKISNSGNNVIMENEMENNLVNKISNSENNVIMEKEMENNLDNQNSNLENYIIMEKEMENNLENENSNLENYIIMEKEMDNNLENQNSNLENYIIMGKETLYGFEIANWYCDEQDLKRNTPSILYGMSYNTECRYRARGIQFIKDLAEKFELGYNTIATAAVFFHRFYIHRGFQHFPEYRTAASCLYLAGKVDDTPKLSKVILHQIRPLLNPAVYLYNYGENDKKEFYIMERVLLYTLKMDFLVDHPYCYIVEYAKTLTDSKGDASLHGKVVQMAWNFINDSLYITLCIQYEPQILAIAALYLAAELNYFEVVDWVNKMPDHIVWWDSFVDDLSIETVRGIADQMMNNAYQSKIDLEHDQLYLNSLESDISNAPASLCAIRLIPDSLTPNSYNLVLSSSDCPMLSDTSTDTADESNKNNQNRSDDDRAPLDIQQPNRSESLSSSRYSWHSSRVITPSYVQADIDNGVYRVANVPDELELYGYEFRGRYHNDVRNPVHNDDDNNDDNDRHDRLHAQAFIPSGQSCVHQNVHNWLERNDRLNGVDGNINIAHDGINNNNRDRINIEIDNFQRENALSSLGQGSQNVRENRGQNGQQNPRQNPKRNRKRNRKPNRKKNRKRRS